MSRRVERTAPVGELNFDSYELPLPDGCVWCGADLNEDEKCDANCEASRRRVDRMDV